jgi:hypothetical protein
MQKFKNNSSSFWLDDDINYDVLTGDKIKAGKDYVKMAATKRAIGNFVSIVTGKSIPVTYSSKDESFTDGKQVVISSNIKDKDFDPTVGLALHEGSHCLLTDFTILKKLMDNPNSIPQNIFDAIADKYANDPNHTLEDKTWIVCNYIRNHVKSLLNYVEDRRIDSFVYKSAPGYQGYYKAMYNKYFNAKIVDKGLQSSEMRDLDWKSYMFRIINLTNVNRDMDALPGLKDIWKLLDLKKIDRLKSTDDALQIAFEIFSIVESNIPTPEQKEKEKEKQKGGGGKQAKKKGGTEMPLSQKGQLQRQAEKQNDFIDNNVKKTTMSNSDKKKVKAVQESGSEIKTVGNGLAKNYYTPAGNGVKCVVVKNITDSLIESGIYETVSKDYRYWRAKDQQYDILKGIKLGTMLGRKLQIRNDSNSLTYNRLRKGKLDKRMVASLGFGNEQVFNQIFVDKFNPAIVHISIDASGSMSGDKWSNSQTSAVAIAKAASMVQNLDVVISYRSTEQIGSETLPAIFIAYDSRKDKITKITRQFQYINCPGTTPEGLCFEAIEKLITDGNNGTDSYFINFSDGEPYFENKDISYYGHTAQNHTRKQIESMTSRGIKVLSYFISGNYSSDMENFRKMYGNNAENINVTKLNDLTKSLNKTFATK